MLILNRSTNVGLICYGSDDVAPATFPLREIRNPFADPQYSADHGFHGPLPHISACDVIQQKYSINSSIINM